MTLPVSKAWLERKGVRTASAFMVQKRPIDALFAKQREVIDAPDRFKALLCGSRAGKTETVLRGFVDAMQLQPGAPFLYAAPTRPLAKNILWEPLRRLNIAEGWGLQLHESELRARHPNGAWLLLAGMDSQPELEKARGIPWQRVVVDECGSIKSSHLQYYVEEVVHPRLMDRKGDCWLAGTPGRVPVGFFFKITSDARYGWRTFRWTAADNPHVDLHDFVHHPATGWLALRQCTEDSPAFKREILGLWCIDEAHRVMRFDASRNTVERLPVLSEGDEWVRSLTLDFGVGHATAAIVLAYPRYRGRDAYVIDSWQATGLAPSDAAVRIRKTWDEYAPCAALIGDVNGLGKGFEREWAKMFPDVAMRPAIKHDKRAALEIVSDRFHAAQQSERWQERRGLFVVRGVGANEELIAQNLTVQWDEDRADIAPGQADDLLMAQVYGYRYCPAFDNAASDPEPMNVTEGPFDRFVQRKQWPKPPDDVQQSFRGAFRRREW